MFSSPPSEYGLCYPPQDLRSLRAPQPQQIFAQLCQHLEASFQKFSSDQHTVFNYGTNAVVPVVSTEQLGCALRLLHLKSQRLFLLDVLGGTENSFVTIAMQRLLKVADTCVSSGIICCRCSGAGSRKKGALGA